VAARPKLGRKRSEASRHAILSAALDLLRAEGYGGLTVDGIASAAGVGKQTIYRWWSSKAEVVLEALTDDAKHNIPVAVSGDPESDLRHFLEATFRLLRGRRGLAPVLKGLMAEAQLDAEFAALFRTHFIEQRRAALLSVVERARPEPEASALVDMLFGAMWYRLLVEHAPLDDRFAALLADIAARE
jgi:AcrR family transcriptional regulator